MNVVALHGFLGSPGDFSGWQGISLDSHLVPFEDFAEAVPAGDVLVGYSLGGRLALHALIAEPKRWKAAVIISAHPGLASHLREERLERDCLWAERFLQDPWEKVINDWNSQEVFGGHCIYPEEKDFSRKNLAWMLKHWSLGKQEDLREAIAKVNIPILWVVGERDGKFCEVAKGVQFFHPCSQVWVCPGVGHRVVHEGGKLFFQRLDDRINSLLTFS